MSWGATAFTPIIVHNEPPFGFAEKPQDSDYPTCPEDPYSGTRNIKDNIKLMPNGKRSSSNSKNTTEQFVNLGMINPINTDNSINYPKMIMLCLILWFVWTYLLSDFMSDIFRKFY